MKRTFITTNDRLFDCLLMAACLTPMTFSGCAEEPMEVGGGASVVPEVTFLPAELGGDSEAAVSSPDSTAATPKTGAAGSGPGTVSGRVVMSGGGPTLPPLFVQGAAIKDKEVCAAHDVADERLILGTDSGVSNVFVFMKKAPKGSPKFELPEQELVFDQKNCQFLPHCMIVPVGQDLRVLSDDPIAHNTHTNPAKNNGMSSVVPPNDRKGVVKVKYTRSEDPFSVTCDFHAWMKAYHMPLDHPYGAVTDKDGKFEIKDVPAGTHDFVVWHEAASGNYVERKLKITVKAGAVTEQTIDYPASKLAM